jgi:hypothetical protein
VVTASGASDSFLGNRSCPWFLERLQVIMYVLVQGVFSRRFVMIANMAQPHSTSLLFIPLSTYSFTPSSIHSTGAHFYKLLAQHKMDRMGHSLLLQGAVPPVEDN